MSTPWTEPIDTTSAVVAGEAVQRRVIVSLGGNLQERSGIGFGCMSASGQYSNGVPLDEDGCMELFKGVYDAGCRHFDTAEVYKSGPLNAPPSADTIFNECQLRKFFATVERDAFTVATKYMPLVHENKSDYETVRAALVASLTRLGLDYVDLYYSHRVLTCEQGVEFALSVGRLIKEGLVRNIGLSEIPVEWLVEAHAAHPICCIQQEWSLLTREVEQFLVPTCKALGIGIVAYSPLARNLLTLPAERPQDTRRSTIPRYSEEHFESNKKMLKQVEELAVGKGVSPAQFSLAWLVHKAQELNVTCLPIPGTAKLQHALDNIASVQIVLSPNDMTLLEGIAALSAGARESEKYLSITMERGLSSKI